MNVARATRLGANSARSFLATSARRHAAGIGHALPGRMNRPRMHALVATALLSAGCSVSQDQEVAIGRQNAEQINAHIPIVSDSASAEYVRQLGLSMARTTSRPDLDWQFFIVDSRDVNAFALPGGFIYVNRGLIDHAQQLDELAGAIGHEIGHVVRRHSVQQMQSGAKANIAVSLTCTLTRLCNSNLAHAAIQLGGAALFARYSRHDEAEADSEAVVNVMKAGIDPHGIPVLFERLLEERKTAPLRIEAFFASHPMEEDRIAATRREIQSLDASTLQGLKTDDAGYRAFKERLNALPRAPDPAPSQQLAPEELRRP